MKPFLTSISLLFFISCKLNHQEPQVKDTSGLIKFKNASIYYEKKGIGDPILLLHGGFLEHTMWDPQIGDLSKEHTVITIDLPGHGKSVGDTNILIKDIILNVLDSLGIKNTSIGGLSLGASCVQDFVIAYPERVNKAILVASGINGYDKKFKVDSLSMSWYNALGDALEGKDTARAAAIFTKSWCIGLFRDSLDMKQSARDYVYNTTLTNMREHKVMGWPRFTQPPAMENIDKINLPVLIIDGSKDLPVIRNSCDYLEKNIKGAKRITIPNTAHMPNLEEPELFNKYVLEFLRQ
jgi:pimeloyl-ACP methyl ester carboxylesterase